MEREAVGVQAGRSVAEGLRRLGWSEETLQAQRKGDPQKVGLARQLRARTTLLLAWIAGRLRMGQRVYLAWLLSQQNKAKPTLPTEQELLKI
jgi:hypothetical protein